jgi:coenzyme F420 hydrogenase subunit beta
MSLVKLEIDGQQVVADEGTTLLEAARSAGILIPTLCYHPLVEPFGACRLCSVKITKRGRSKIVTACNYPVEGGLVVETKSPEIITIRKLLIEFLLARCPSVQVIRALAEDYGVEVPRFPQEAETCILCGLCARVCDECVGLNAINFANRGVDRRIEGPLEESLGANLTEACIGCGACAYVCPTGTIKLEEVYQKIRSTFPYQAVEERTFGRPRRADEPLGIYQHAFAARARDEDLLGWVQDGGAVTALLGYALEAGTIDCAVITVAGHEWLPSVKVARDPAELKAGAGTKYTFYPSGLGLLEAAAAGCEKIGFVGTPCQIGGLRRILTSNQPYKLSKGRVQLLIGLFCMETFTQDLMRYLQEKVLPLEELKKLDIKGKELRVYDRTGNLHLVPFTEIERYGNTGCFACPDYTAELADISVGSVGSEAGWSTVLTRTDKGEAVFNGAQTMGYLEVSEKVDLTEIERLTRYKRKRADQHKEQSG